MPVADLESNIFHNYQGKTPGLKSFSALLQNQAISLLGLMGNGFGLKWVLQRLRDTMHLILWAFHMYKSVVAKQTQEQTPLAHY